MNKKDKTQIIRLWPSVGDFASDIGVQYQTAYRMMERGSINPKYWPLVVSSAQRRKIKGVDLSTLAARRSQPEGAA